MMVAFHWSAAGGLAAGQNPMLIWRGYIVQGADSQRSALRKRIFFQNGLNVFQFNGRVYIQLFFHRKIFAAVDPLASYCKQPASGPFAVKHDARADLTFGLCQFLGCDSIFFSKAIYL